MSCFALYCCACFLLCPFPHCCVQCSIPSLGSAVPSCFLSTFDFCSLFHFSCSLCSVLFAFHCFAGFLLYLVNCFLYYLFILLSPSHTLCSVLSIMLCYAFLPQSCLLFCHSPYKCYSTLSKSILGIWFAPYWCALVCSRLDVFFWKVTYPLFHREFFIHIHSLSSSPLRILCTENTAEDNALAKKKKKVSGYPTEPE